MSCYIHRVGQLCGDSVSGAWNSTEMYPLTIVGRAGNMKKVIIYYSEQ
jgi:thioester reductase-like protein